VLIKNLNGCFVLVVMMAVLAVAGTARADLPIEDGFDEYTLPHNDDNSTGLVDIGFDPNFYGVKYTQLHVNNNGNVTLNREQWDFNPFALTASLNNPIIAPFFADVDTTSGNEVTYGQGTFRTRSAFGVNWIGVGRYSQQYDKLNTFQLLLVDRSDVGPGDFDIRFNYGDILWDAVTASGGNSAVVGFSNGAGNYYEVPGSGVHGAFINGGDQSLRDIRILVFEVRNGVPTPTPLVPTPSAFLLGAIGLGGVGLVRRLRRKKIA